MKTIKQKLSLAGTEEIISISELRAKPGEILAQVELGATFHIRRQGKKIATLSPPEPSAFELGAEVRRLKL